MKQDVSVQLYNPMPRPWTLSDIHGKPALPRQPGILTGQPQQAAGKKPALPRKSACKQSESEQQSECVAWFRSEYPQYELVFYSVPNGGHRSKRTAAILKREGVVSGIPDQCLAVPRNGFHGLYIEQKIPGNKPTENQSNVMAALAALGYRCEICYSTDQFKEIINSYLNN